jgi:hypothetical protein
MNVDTFSDMHLVKMAQLKKGYIMKTLQFYSVRDNLLFHRRLTESIAGFSKRNKHLLTIQWELVCIAEMIRRACWQAIYDDFKVAIQLKYPNIKEDQLKLLTKDKTEKLIRKYSF